MASLESAFLKARETFDNQVNAIREKLLAKVEDFIVAEHAEDEEVDVTDAEDELYGFDDAWGDVDLALDKIQDEINRLEE